MSYLLWHERPTLTCSLRAPGNEKLWMVLVLRGISGLVFMRLSQSRGICVGPRAFEIGQSRIGIQNGMPALAGPIEGRLLQWKFLFVAPVSDVPDATRRK